MTTVEDRTLIDDAENKAGYKPGPYDVLCGRDRASFNHEGNRKFRAVVQLCLPRYRATRNRAEKANIADYIEAGVREKGGRFLKQDSQGIFRELNRVGRREKITHALRDAIKKDLETRNKKENRFQLLHQACQLQSEKDAAAAVYPNKSSSTASTASSSSNGSEAQEQEDYKKEATKEANTTKGKSEPEQGDESAARIAAEAMMAQRNGFPGPFGGMPRGMNPYDPRAMMQAGSMPQVVSPMTTPSDLAEGGSMMPPGLALLEKASTAIDQKAKEDGSTHGENAYLAYKGMPHQAAMANMNPHQKVAFFQEQVRVMTMMLAMREQEIGVLKHALWESARTGATKDKEIMKLKEEIAMKDRTLSMQRREPRGDPPDNHA